MRFLRTSSTARLLTSLAAALIAVCAAAAIAVAAVGSGPVPRATALPKALHTALSAKPVAGVSADVTFTDNLIDSSDFTGQASDPLLQGASGRLWISNDGRLRIELQSGNGDAQIVVDHRSFWISDPSQNAVYEGTLPAASGAAHPDGHGVPTVAAIQSALTRLMRSVDVSGAQPTDVGGQPAYRVTVSPKGSGGLIGSVGLAWDAARGIPLSFDVYARGDAQPVLGLTASNVAYGAVPASVFTISPPTGAKVTQLGTLAAPGSGAAHARHSGHAAVTGARAVAARLPFHLSDPASTAGLPRTSVRLLGSDSALVVYGHGLGAISVIETAAHGKTAAAPTSAGGLSLPTRRIGGASATVLSTPLGTVLHLTRDGVGYTVIGSVTGAAAQSAASGLF